MTNLRSLSFNEELFPFISTGVINYKPTREHTKFSGESICVIDTDEEISSFYRKLWMQRFPHIPILKPAWPAHISVMRGTRILDASKEWGYQNGEPTIFHYSGEIEYSESHVWINVYSKAFFELRDYYNIPIKENHGHITIAKFR